jgi:hypothetical protein
LPGLGKGSYEIDTQPESTQRHPCLCITLYMKWLTTSRILASVVILPLVAAGCSQTAVRGPAGATAPALSGESPAHIRGVSDPNAQFTLIDRTKSSSQTPGSDGQSVAPPCTTASLQVYEVGASLHGNDHVIRLAFKNYGDASCSLSGYPGIELQDERGLPIASIAVRQTGSASLTGTVATAVETTATSSPVAILLRPSRAATFEIGWSSGEECPLVSRIMISMPRLPVVQQGQNLVSGSFTISHPLSVCGGAVQVSTLVDSGMS